MANLWAQLRRDRGPNGEKHMIHVEFGHFSNQEIFELFDKYAVRNADSLGMNEVEMKLLIDAWTNESRFINTD
jgi:ADP-dependent phosphofructokinase/glucokinase